MGKIEDRRRERLRELTQTDMPLWQMETLFAGMDEAGRGPLAGAVVTACVVMPPEPLLLWVDDSKKLSETRRESLYEEIIQTALFWQIGQASAEEIDTLNILGATRLAMRRASERAPCDLFLCDDVPHLQLPGAEVRCMVKGDQRCYSIAAASILAKVTRDRQLREMDQRYPGYGFAKHKGYGTAEHIQALRRLGPCPEHRRSFIAKFVQGQRMNRRSIGQAGEDAALAHLTAQGMQLKARNYCIRGGEVDLIMRDGEYTVFVEVKLRNNARYGTGREAVSPAKIVRICKAALRYIIEEGLHDTPVRFDVVEVQQGRLTHLPNAFPFVYPDA